MKDLRGFNVAAVKNAVFREIGVQVLANKRKTPKDISDWKSSKQVKECYKKFYNDDDNVIERIAKRAFPTSTSEDDEKFDKIFAYTAAVCDIVFNPDYPDIECARKPLERRYRRFKVWIFIV